MPDLKDQIRAYYEATTEPVDLDTITVEPGTLLVGPFPDASARRSIVRTDTDPRTEPVRRRIRGLSRAVAAAAAIAILGTIGFALTQRIGQDAASGSNDEDAGIAAVDRFYEAIAAGDPAAIRDVLDPAFSLRLPGRIMDSDEFLAYAAWEAIAGPQYDSRLCSPASVVGSGTAVESSEMSGTAIVCEYERHPYLHRTVNVEPVPATDTVIVSVEERVLTVDRSFNVARQATVNTRFETWVSIVHPGELERARSGASGSVPPPWRDGPSAAAENASVHVQYADEWAAHLEANGCAWDQPCPP